MTKFFANSHWVVPYLLLSIVSILFFYPILLENKVLIWGDNTLHIVPNIAYWQRSVMEEGILPLWNPYVFAGMPHFANLATNTISPFNVVALIISNPFKVVSILVVFQIFLASIWMYWFLNSLNLNRYAALVGAITFAYSGSVLSAANDLNSLASMVFLPLVMWRMHFQIQNPSLHNHGWVSLALALQFISGHPQYSYYTWIVSGSYWLVFAKGSLLSKIISAMHIYGLCVGLVALQLLPFLELSNHTYRPKALIESTYKEIEILDLPRFVIAHIYGTWSDGTSWGPDAPLEQGRADSEGYVGVIPLLLSVYVLLMRRNKLSLFFLGVGVISLILSFGQQTLLYTLAQELLPLFSKFRSPYRIVVVYVFAIAVVSALGLDQVIKKYVKS